MNWQEFASGNKSWITTEVNEQGTVFFYEKDNPDILIFSISINGYTLFDFSDTTLFEQHKTINFLKQGADEWYKKPLYNIVIGSNLDGYTFTAYAHYERNGAKAYYVNNGVTEYDLKSEKYKFTQDEIDDLKSKLPENMKRIVDLGKTEVNGNDD